MDDWAERGEGSSTAIAEFDWMSERYLLIDGNNMVYRDHAVGGDCAYNATRRIGLMRRRYGISRVIACWDAEDNRRKEEFPWYKAGRKRPEGIDASIGEVRSAIEQVGVESYRSGCGDEADDLIAHFCNEAMGHDAKVTIYSDSDLHQLLIRSYIRQLLKFACMSKTYREEWCTQCILEDKRHVRPEQWVDYRVMIGDPDKGIRGFRGIGVRRAVEVLQKFGTLDSYYADPEQHELVESVRVGLDNGRSRLGMLRNLLELRVNSEPIAI